ncbi:M23 family metallopeptidase, partial [Sandarakinorhabdus rubra]|uniref:M23 family metallopeptidase n=1 Tax=Sandarakinorhabdus rubra TaxID=2672568 RepID=UPI001F25D08B
MPQKPRRTDWVARRVVPDAVTTPQGRFHVVKSGETGIAIAQAYGLPWREIIALNNLQEPFLLRVGQRLRLSAAPQPTQTLEDRARAFDVTIDDVVTGGQPAAGRSTPGSAETPSALPA